MLESAGSSPPRRGGFQKGKPRHEKAGRKTGTPNVFSKEVSEMGVQLVQNPRYLRNLQRRLISGKCAPAVEVAVWAYAYGRPVQRLDVTSGGKPLQLDDNQLRDRLRSLLGGTSPADLPAIDIEPLPPPLALPEGESDAPPCSTFRPNGHIANETGRSQVNATAIIGHDAYPISQDVSLLMQNTAGQQGSSTGQMDDEDEEEEGAAPRGQEAESVTRGGEAERGDPGGCPFNGSSSRDGSLVVSPCSSAVGEGIDENGGGALCENVSKRLLSPRAGDLETRTDGVGTGGIRVSDPVSGGAGGVSTDEVVVVRRDKNGRVLTPRRKLLGWSKELPTKRCTDGRTLRWRKP